MYRAILVAVAAGFPLAGLAGQQDTTLIRRWVGMHHERPLQLEFYGDTMLVVGDRHALNYRITGDSIVAEGDTSFAVRYRLSLGYLLLETPDSDVITMKAQSLLARPVTGRWIGEVGADHPQGAELVLTTDRVCRFRSLPDGPWRSGEWERETRKVRLIWTDSLEWSGQYDPVGNAMLFEELDPGSASAIFRRVLR